MLEGLSVSLSKNDEMVALHRYLSKLFPQIGNPFKKEEAK